MKKLCICIFLLLIFPQYSLFPLETFSIAFAQQKPIPPYAKWGQLAVKETQKKYPNARVVDYLHVGRISGERSSTEKFKLWLKGTQKEFGVFVDIEFNNQTEKVIKITYRETPR